MPRTTLIQGELAPATPPPPTPVTCLGRTFADDDARRAFFTEQLRDHLQDPAFRAIEGFPLGEDEDILALSDPPYYTACPNPFLPQIWRVAAAARRTPRLAGAGRRTYHREPFAADVSEGKNDPIYNAHSYHTKVPHKAIMRYILHYTEPGDIVFDGFCGTGMTGVAAQLCGDRKAVQGLGYRVDAGRNHFRRGVRAFAPGRAQGRAQRPIARRDLHCLQLQYARGCAGVRARDQAHSQGGGGRVRLDVRDVAPPL